MVLKEVSALSRRQMVDGVGAAMVSNASAFAQNSSSREMGQMDDPTTKYPKPPLQEAIATMAWPRRQDGSAAGPW